ncbi:AAA family ATPase [Flammeovirga sp. OC4]|uniref:AAA family ATPase n=1 Tax=Flammeovirga sp. OC4 TaxID=1382345 RepID=UPI0005C4D4B9|nr:AAA family ATPase [Flammeovirga sp. OC4]
MAKKKRIRKGVPQKKNLKWYDAFNELTKLLLKESIDSVGYKLYRLIMDYKSNGDTTLSLFLKDYQGFKEVDPVFIYSVISSEQFNYKSADFLTYLINKLSKTRDIKINIEDDWYGHVVAPNLYEYNQRDIHEIKRLWKNFYRLFKKEDYERVFDYQEYFGIKGLDLSYSSLFVYWVVPHQTLPFVNYVNDFLEIASFHNGPVNPRTYHTFFDKANSSFKEDIQFRLDVVDLANQLLNNFEGISDNAEFKIKLSKLDELDFLNKANVDFYINTIRDTSFKLVALKVHENCSSNIRKILNEDDLYLFDESFHFDIEGDQTKVSIDKNKLIDLYSKGDRKINVTAVVGKNGSGKSTLIYLLYGFINNLFSAYRNNSLDLVNDLDCEIYYTSLNKLYSLRIDLDFNVTKKQFTLRPDLTYKLDEDLLTLWDSDINLDDFFYTISLDYSHYSLSNNDIIDWAHNHYHKVDGYQSPLVINPNRTKEKKTGDIGNIDINKEREISQYRLLSLIILNSDFFEKGDIQFIDELSIKRIELKFKKNPSLEQNYSSYKKEILLVIRKYNLPINARNISRINKILLCYLIDKLINICSEHFSFDRYIGKDEQFIDFDLLLDAIDENNSHITLKVRQVLNFINNYSTNESTDKQYIVINDTIILENFKELRERILSIDKESNSVFELEEYLPPMSLFDQEIYFKSNTSEVTLKQLSSGQKQMFFSMASILYHLKNIDSVVKSQDNIKYNFVNILLDEIEQYFHPELQRNYIKNLWRAVSSLRLKNIKGINILLSTHSPFILSDIPSHNVLKLNEGRVEKGKNNSINSFGANIHEMLATDFFMGKHGTIGAFAQIKINECIGFLNDDEKEGIHLTKEKCKIIIDNIGEPVIRNILIEQWNEKFNEALSEEEKQKEVINLAQKLGVDINKIRL